jgi:hypothetical protein
MPPSWLHFSHWPTEDLAPGIYIELSDYVCVFYEKGHITWEIIDVRAIDKEMAITGVTQGREDAGNGHATSDVTP